MYVDFSEMRNSLTNGIWLIIRSILMMISVTGFEEGEEIQQSIEEYSIDTSNYRHRSRTLW
jgi:hypothetical protein